MRIYTVKRGLHVESYAFVSAIYADTLPFVPFADLSLPASFMAAAAVQPTDGTSLYIPRGHIFSCDV
jgi:hypothetical protein